MNHSVKCAGIETSFRIINSYAIHSAVLNPNRCLHIFSSLQIILNELNNPVKTSTLKILGVLNVCYILNGLYFIGVFLAKCQSINFFIHFVCVCVCVCEHTRAQVSFDKTTQPAVQWVLGVLFMVVTHGQGMTLTIYPL
jgi:hypothetical protein